MKVFMKFFVGVIALSLFTLYSCSEDDDMKTINVIGDVASVKDKFVDKEWLLVKTVGVDVDYENKFVLKEITKNGEFTENGEGKSYYQIIKFDSSKMEYYDFYSEKDESGKDKFPLTNETKSSWEIKGSAIVIKSPKGQGEYEYTDWHIKEVTDSKLVLVILSKEDQLKEMFEKMGKTFTDEEQKNIDIANKAGALHLTRTYELVTLNEDGYIVKK